MAESGTFYTTVATGFRLQMEWELDRQSVTSNRSTITARLYWMSLSSGYVVYSSASKTAGIQYNDGSWDRKTASGLAALNGNQKKLIHSKTFNVYHDSDGTCDFNLDGYFDANVTLNGVYYGTINLTQKSYTLPTIPRTSKPSVNDASVFLRDQTVTISTNRASSSFTHTLTYKIGSASGTIGTNVAASKSWTPPISLANQITSGTNAVCTIYCKTYSGSTLIGTETKTIQLYVPNDIVPSVSISKRGLDLFGGHYVQDHSKVTVTLATSGTYGSTITSKSTKVNGATYTTTSFTTGVLLSVGTNTIETTVTDSRGRKKTTSTTFTVEPYTNPKTDSLTATRCDATGEEDPQGAYMKLVGIASYASIQGANTLLTTMRYRAIEVEDWTEATYDNSSDNPTLFIIVPADINTAYEVQLIAQDAYGSSLKAVNVKTAFVLMDFNASGKGVSFGEVSTTDELTINMPFVIKQTPRLMAPTSTEADGAMAELRRADGSMLAVIATGPGGQGIRFKMHDGLNFTSNIDISTVQAHQLTKQDGSGLEMISDYDLVSKAGYYYAVTGTENAPLSVHGWFLHVINHPEDDTVLQIAISNSNENMMYIRRKINGSWMNWTVMISGTNVQSGDVYITPSSPDVPTGEYISFPEFKNKPIVVATPNTTVPGKTVQGVGITNVTNDSARLWLTRSNTTPTLVSWIAVDV